MKLNNYSILSLLIFTIPVQAQDTSFPSSTGRFYVELRDTTLADAEELAYKAIGNPPHIIDPAAEKVNIGFVSFPNVVGTELPRILATQYSFRIRRNESGAYVVEPRPVVGQVYSFSQYEYLPPKIDNNTGKEFRIIPFRHVYVGGFLKVFSGKTNDITTEQFVIPSK